MLLIIISINPGYDTNLGMNYKSKNRKTQHDYNCSCWFLSQKDYVILNDCQMFIKSR